MNITPATLSFLPEGIPFSVAFDDIYHAQDGGLAQAQHVFLQGNGLPQRWQGQQRFVIAETGFGLGLNFLSTWAAWHRDERRSAQLHFISVEQFPFRLADLDTLHGQLLGNDSLLHELSKQLRAQWPLLIKGFHRLHLDGGRVTLTLVFGDAQSWLGQIAAKVDAFYLDGFAPAKNPELWSAKLFKQFARLAASGATLATYTVAGSVRRGLEAAGFVLSRRAGFARKREMLCGVFRAARPKPVLPAERHAIVVGAGLAGACISACLARRGWRITLLDAAVGPASAASGNHAGAFRPVVSTDDNLQARLARAAFLYGVQALDALGDTVSHARCGALQLARDAEEALRFQRIARDQGWPERYLRYVCQDEASALAGLPVPIGGLWFADGGWISPPSLVATLLATCGTALATRFGSKVAALTRQGENWQACAADGSLLAAAPVVILANAADAMAFAPDIVIGRDQRWLTHLDEASAPQVNTVICRRGYLTPYARGLACIGSSTIQDQDGCGDAHRHNQQLLAQMLAGTHAPYPTQAAGRLCTRPSTGDWLPIAGPLADADDFLPKHAGSLHLAPRRAGLYALTGFGARGLMWCQLLAELLASQINGDPLPLERELALAVDPARFLARRSHGLTPAPASPA